MENENVPKRYNVYSVVSGESEKHVLARDLAEAVKFAGFENRDNVGVRGVLEDVLVSPLLEKSLIDKYSIPIVKIFDGSTRHLDVRARRCLEQEGIETLGDLAKKDLRDLSRARYIGNTTINYIRSKMREYGL